MDLTGCKLWFTAKQFITDADAIALIQKTWAAGQIAVPTPALGIATLTLVNADTTALVPNNPATLYFFDVQVEDAAGNVFTPIMGRLQVLPGVTQSV